jgi:membrane protease subunit HflC
VLLAEAQKFAEETRGKAEAEAAKIYADAHSQDPKFYSFLRELETLRKVTRENTTLILDTDTAPFNQLKGTK